MNSKDAKDVQIPVHAEVICSDGLCGHSTNVLVNPVDEKVTHVVVKTNTLPPVEYIVPITMVGHTDAEHIQLRLTKDELAHLDPFINTEYVEDKEPSYLTGQGVGTYMYWPYVIPYVVSDMPVRIPVEHPQIPPGELAVKSGTRVQATDGYVGKVDEFMVNPDTGNITHLVMREGHLWGQKDVSIPVSAIKEMRDNTVVLNLNKQQIEVLPVIPIKRMGS